MEIGTGLAIGFSSIATAAVIMKWISRNDSSRQCAAHLLLDGQVKDLKEWLIRIEAKLDAAIH